MTNPTNASPVRTVAAIAAGASAPRLALAGRRVLVVDDSQATRVILQGILERAGMQVETASDGGMAFWMVNAGPERFDLIVMDLVMEGMDGFRCMEQIVPLLGRRHCPIVATSATVTPQILARCRSLGAYKVMLTKPYRASDVLDVLGLAVLDDKSVSPVVGADPGAAQALQPAAAPARDGIDTAGALDRCGGDTAMLRALLDGFALAVVATFEQIRASLQNGRIRTAARQLHKVRGEAVNLGLDTVAREVANVEYALQRSEPPDALVDALEVSCASAVLRALNAVPLHEPAPGGGAEFDVLAFRALVESMLESDPTVIARRLGGGRLLPADYADDVEEQFRRRAEVLDFAGARRLLHARDDGSGPMVRPAGESVLIVDDDPVVVLLLARALEGTASIRFALQGEVALQLARDFVPDLVLADVHMEGMSGIELCKRFKAPGPLMQVPVILMSANNDIANEVQALTAGAADFIEKPLNMARVLGRVTAQLANHRRNLQIAGLLATDPGESGLGFLICNASGALGEVGPVLARTLGYRQPDAGLGNLRELVDPDSWVAIAANLQSGAGGGRLRPLDVKLRTSTGSLLPVRLQSRLVSGEGGGSFWISVEDLRGQVQLNLERLNRAKAEALSSITSGIAHEFNNLLGIVIGNLDNVIEEPGDQARMPARLQAAQDAALRAADISRALLGAARSAPRAGLPARLGDLLDDMWPILSNMLPKSIRLVRARDGDSLWALVDPAGLRDCLLALLQNAIDAMPQGGEVVVSTLAVPPPASAADAPAEPVPAISVSDNGPGMSQAVRERAFDPFFTTRSPQRVGLGLSTVLGFATANAGAVDVRSAPGQGSTFTLRLARAPYAPNLEAPPPAGRTEPRTRH
jgi:CheY-like chemotaxis protein